MFDKMQVMVFAVVGIVAALLVYWVYSHYMTTAKQVAQLQQRVEALENGTKLPDHVLQEFKSESKSDGILDSKLGGKADTKHDSKVEAKLDIKAETKLESKSDSKSDSKLEMKLDTKPEPKLDDKHNVEQTQYHVLTSGPVHKAIPTQDSMSDNDEECVGLCRRDQDEQDESDSDYEEDGQNHPDPAAILFASLLKGLPVDGLNLMRMGMINPSEVASAKIVEMDSDDEN